MDEKYQYLSFNVKVLKMMNMWPNGRIGGTPKWKQWTSYYTFIVLIPVALPIIIECCLVFTEKDLDVAIQLQSVLAASCIIGMFYMGICFLRNSEHIKEIIEHLDDFKKYSNLDIIEVDKQASWYSKAMLVYAIIGTLIYTCMPFITIQSCEEYKTRYMVKYGIPCGTITRFRLPFRYDMTPLFEIFAVHTMILAGVTTLVIVNSTMLVCGLLVHVISQLQQLRKYILVMSTGDIAENVQYIIKYHIAIIRYIDDINKAFGSQLLLHITLTSFVISVLGFIIITVNNVADSVRFTLHLAGWFLMLFYICHNGQLLINESFSVAIDVYDTEWHTCPVKVQKDLLMIIMRAQKPIVIKAFAVEIFSATTFLKILRSAYTYFTLLLNLKK